MREHFKSGGTCRQKGYLCELQIGPESKGGGENLGIKDKLSYIECMYTCHWTKD